MLQPLVEIQRDIYLALAEQIKLLSAQGNWLGFLAFTARLSEPLGAAWLETRALRGAGAHTARSWR